MRTAVSILFALLALLAASVRGEAQEPKGEAYQPVKDIALDDEIHRYLHLGEKTDYLETERHRIIDQILQAIPPLYEPVRPFHGYTLPPGTWRVGTTVTVGRNRKDFGRDDFYSLFFKNLDIDFVNVNLSISHGFELGSIRDLTVRLDIPYRYVQIDGTGKPFRIQPFDLTMNAAGNGFGDVKLTLKKKWVDQGNGPVNFATMIGIIIPTAEDQQRFSPGQVFTVMGVRQPMAPSIDVFGTRPGQQLLPRSAQPGNGAWGVRLGFGLTHQFERSALHAGAVFDILAQTEGITPGDELRYGVSFVIPPFSSDRVTVDISIVGMWKGDEKFPGMIMHAERDPATGGPIVDSSGKPVMFTTRRPNFEHGHMLFFSPSVIFIPTPATRIIFSPSIRILEPDRGPSPEFVLTIGFTTTF